MGATGICIATRGIICTPNRAAIYTTTAEHPVMSAVVEVRPSIRGAASESPAPTPVVAPVIVTAQTVRPEIRQASSESPSGGSDEPKVISAEDLRPIIRSTEES
jgi:hypothetical protein